MSLWIPVMLYLEYIGLAWGFNGTSWEVPYLQNIFKLRQIMTWGTILYIVVTSARIYSQIYPEIRFPGGFTPKKL